MSVVLSAGAVDAATGAGFGAGAATTTGADTGAGAGACAGAGAFWRMCSMSLAAGAVTAVSLSSKDGGLAAGAMVSGSAPAVMLFLRRILRGRVCHQKVLA